MGGQIANPTDSERPPILGGMRQRTVFARSQRYARKRENGKTAGEERRAGGAVVVKASGRRRVRRIGKTGGWERGVK
ncbi:hypothetical protein BO85DRAFT_385503 [Aspergillus piperis CBS 112811]|uniref:Uncharacterized protein n=1 Tax=Aspergillus piperis CBS 112811 TaxID=1448313 RepID=A0A8G1QQ53_9EURO|nr:hypothetical protein BO85DRAFT_385503 [Aspergillus piperis CBS 112811]RAH51778.1 hypothetical protein BO85DRAFT_385503 [Aspergillus piperis CBS 112811]